MVNYTLGDVDQIAAKIQQSVGESRSDQGAAVETDEAYKKAMEDKHSPQAPKAAPAKGQERSTRHGQHASDAPDNEPAAGQEQQAPAQGFFSQLMGALTGKEAPQQGQSSQPQMVSAMTPGGNQITGARLDPPPQQPVSGLSMETLAQAKQAASAVFSSPSQHGAPQGGMAISQPGIQTPQMSGGKAVNINNSVFIGNMSGGAISTGGGTAIVNGGGIAVAQGGGTAIANGGGIAVAQQGGTAIANNSGVSLNGIGSAGNAHSFSGQQPSPPSAQNLPTASIKTMGGGTMSAPDLGAMKPPSTPSPGGAAPQGKGGGRGM